MNFPCRLIFASALPVVRLLPLLLAISVPAFAQDEPEPPEEKAEPAEAGEQEPMNNAQLGDFIERRFKDHVVTAVRPGFWTIELQRDDEEDKEEEAPEQEAETLEDSEDPSDEESDSPEEEADDEDPRALIERALKPREKLDPVVMVMTDERADRMRVMMPIQPFNPNAPEDAVIAMIVLQANYDRALDARYATHQGLLWSAFIHPLSPLEDAELENAFVQVIGLRDNTGTSYSSGVLQFAPAVAAPQEELATR